MNRPIPRRLAESEQFTPLRQLARRIARDLWRRGVVQRWTEDRLLDHLQQLGNFTGLSGVEEWPGVRDEFLATGFLVDEDGELVLPILSADHPREQVTKDTERQRHLRELDQLYPERVAERQQRRERERRGASPDAVTESVTSDLVTPVVTAP